MRIALSLLVRKYELHTAEYETAVLRCGHCARLVHYGPDARSILRSNLLSIRARNMQSVLT